MLLAEINGSRFVKSNFKSYFENELATIVPGARVQIMNSKISDATDLKLPDIFDRCPD